MDDNRDAAASLGTLLGVMGNTVPAAHNGEEAVRAAGEFRPDVVLLDIGLPKVNGYDACRAIRREAWGQEMVLIAVTDWGRPATSGIRERPRSTGTWSSRWTRIC